MKLCMCVCFFSHSLDIKWMRECKNRGKKEMVEMARWIRFRWHCHKMNDRKRQCGYKNCQSATAEN